MSARPSPFTQWESDFRKAFAPPAGPIPDVPVNCRPKLPLRLRLHEAARAKGWVRTVAGKWERIDRPAPREAVAGTFASIDAHLTRHEVSQPASAAMSEDFRAMDQNYTSRS